MNVNRPRLRGLLLALVSTLLLAGTGSAPAAAAQETTAQAEVQRLVEAIRKYRAASRHWHRVMGTPPRKAKLAERRAANVADLTARRDFWRRRATRLRKLGWHPPHRPAWRCIHRHEGRWDDPRAPYWGGLQMSMGFQRAFGRYLVRREGTADNWTPAEQMWTAERAHRSGLGFHPWPNTARACGLM
jgi:hypothetical protein